MREWGYFLFFTSFFCLYFAGGMYMAWRVNAGLRLLAPYTYYIYASVGLMTVIATLGGIFNKYNVDSLAGYFSTAGGIWMGVVGIGVTVLFANDMLNLSNHFIKFAEFKNFRYWSTLVSVFLIAALCAWSLLNVALVLKVKEIKIPVRGLKKDISITLLADIHIDKQTSPKTIKKIVGIVNGLNPDVIVMAGDLIDIDVSQTYAKYGLDQLKSKYGIFAVTGNHEYFVGIESYEALCANLGFTLLRNENFTLKDGAESILTVAGINDKQGSGFNVDKVDVDAAFADIDSALPVLFLSHRPQYFDLVKNRQMPVVQLSGHTHAGQIPPMEFLLRVFFKYWRGLYKHNDSTMYLTSGNRWWRVPMRTFNAGEIAVITLSKE